MSEAETPCVYFALDAAHGQIKIGVSGVPERRMLELRRVIGCEPELLASVPHVDAYGLERRLQAALAPSRLAGEWFKDGPALRDALASFVANPESLYSEEERDG